MKFHEPIVEGNFLIAFFFFLKNQKKYLNKYSRAAAGRTLRENETFTARFPPGAWQAWPRYGRGGLGLGCVGGWLHGWADVWVGPRLGIQGWGVGSVLPAAEAALEQLHPFARRRLY